MYPDKPKEFIPNSKEDLMFETLRALPDSYYVFHSFSIVTVKEGTLFESETDFVIFNQQKGILCIEAKAGQIKYEEGVWKYGSGKEMSHDGPYNQAAQNKWKLGKYIQGLGLFDIYNRCKMIHAVWFPSIKKEKFDGVSLPPEADIHITLTQEAEDDIEKVIVDIFDYELPNHKQNMLSIRDGEILINRILAPSFNLISLSEIKHNHSQQVFKVMLREQIALLNYLEEQDNAVISGMAGTGKTVMAVEKARRHADKGESVLFLCYNLYLNEYLRNTYNHDHISFYTIDALACKLCNTSTPDYHRLQEVLVEMYGVDFPYQHVIIDEGQDFGKEQLEEIEIINLLKANVLDNEDRHGTFYMFYDKNQMVQSEVVPDYIEEADCKLTLYRNCRNTRNIAITSLRLLGTEKNPRLIEGALEGDSPELFLAKGIETTVRTINNIIETNWEKDYQNIQILTCKTESTSIIASECSTGVYLYKGRKIPFTTCRKFKGLEADVIIIVDMDYDKMLNKSEQILYVGSSRARYQLALVVEMDDFECNELLDEMHVKKAKKPGKAVAALYNAKYKTLEK